MSAKLSKKHRPSQITEGRESWDDAIVHVGEDLDDNAFVDPDRSRHYLFLINATAGIHDRYDRYASDQDIDLKGLER